MRFRFALLTTALAGIGLLHGMKPPAHPPARRRSREAAFVRELRQHVRHVFVIYQENRSFDSYFGDFPGADNLATAEARAHGFRQWDPLGKMWVTPFLINESVTVDPGHSRPMLYAKSDHGRMDKFVSVQEKHTLIQGETSPAFARQLGLLTMAHENCHTIPFLWYYAHHFALYDHIFQGMYGPSTPGNIDLIAAQTGQTQWARHPNEAAVDSHSAGEPVINDMDPPWGPYAFNLPKAKQLDQTYATLMLTLLGRKSAEAKIDTDDVKQDIGELVKLHHRAVPWGWYQEGFGNGKGNNHPAYIEHHNAPQYFGYIRLNQPLWSGVHDLMDFFTVMANRELPRRSVTFIKGGRINPFGWKSANPNASFVRGDDDHPASADSQLSEALVAKVVNTVARSPYWKSSAIIIFWDDEGGFYDHVPPPTFETCPDKKPCGDGPRIPLILISPYARSGAIVSDPGDHASFAKFLDLLFNLPPLGSLPDEKPYLPLGPRDTNHRLTNLLGGFDPARLAGRKAAIPAAAAEIPDAVVNHFPPAMSCRQTGVEPVKIPGASSAQALGFTNPLP